MKSVVLFGLVAVMAAVVKSQQLIGSGVDCEEIKKIIKTHNNLRRKIAKGEESGQPKASNMQKIVWDDYLAGVAQNWANRMKFEHNANNKDARWWSTGENIYMSGGGDANPKSDWEAAVNSWYSEVKKYTYGPMGEDYINTGHYTQVVWADTTYVGCGYSAFIENGETKKFYVCDYGPGGNTKDVYPYKTGAGCEDLCCKDQCKVHFGSKC